MRKIFLFVLLGFCGSVLAQTEAPPSDNSPYSRFGLGDFNNQNFIHSGSMGNLSAAYNDPYCLNVLNPAASSSLLATSYEFGLNSKFTTMTEKNGNSDKARSGNLGYMALGFPLKNQVNELFDKRKKSDIKYGMHIALVPYTNIGYKIETIKRLPNVDSTQFRYSGTGGTYKFLWGNSLNYKNFALGINMGYFFGKTKSNRQLAFYNLTDNYEVDVINNTIYRGFVWNAGLQYDYQFKKIGKNGKLEPNGKKITFGLYGNSASNFTTKSDDVYYRTNYSYILQGSIQRDSVLKERTNIEGKGKLPSEISVGVMYSKENKFKVGINYSRAGWSAYKNDATKETLLNSYTFGIGGEYTPDFISYNRYSKRIRYPKGRNHIERAMYFTYLGDWISCYLSDHRGVDSIEVKAIDYLKGELAKV